MKYIKIKLSKNINLYIGRKWIQIKRHLVVEKNYMVLFYRTNSMKDIFKALRFILKEVIKKPRIFLSRKQKEKFGPDEMIKLLKKRGYHQDQSHNIYIKGFVRVVLFDKGYSAQHIIPGTKTKPTSIVTYASKQKDSDFIKYFEKL